MKLPAQPQAAQIKEDLCAKNNPKLQKGLIPNYITQVPLQQLVENTLTGFLIKVLSNNTYDLETIVNETLPYYPHFRKVDGKPYTANSARRSIISALSANGIFE
jgi:hypothetical protein